jgi:hypothetical protein
MLPSRKAAMSARTQGSDWRSRARRRRSRRSSSDVMSFMDTRVGDNPDGVQDALQQTRQPNVTSTSVGVWFAPVT